MKNRKAYAMNESWNLVNSEDDFPDRISGEQPYRPEAVYEVILSTGKTFIGQFERYEASAPGCFYSLEKRGWPVWKAKTADPESNSFVAAYRKVQIPDSVLACCIGKPKVDYFAELSQKNIAAGAAAKAASERAVNDPAYIAEVLAKAKASMKPFSKASVLDLQNVIRSQHLKTPVVLSAENYANPGRYQNKTGYKRSTLFSVMVGDTDVTEIIADMCAFPTSMKNDRKWLRISGSLGIEKAYVVQLICKACKDAGLPRLISDRFYMEHKARCNINISCIELRRGYVINGYLNKDTLEACLSEPEKTIWKEMVKSGTLDAI